MKTCEDYMPALSAFADGELNEEEKAALLDHLEGCASCREKLSELMILHTMFEELPELDAPDGFAERVLDRIHESAPVQTKKPRRRALRTLAACAALVLIVGAAKTMLPGTNLLGATSDSAAQYSDTNGAASIPNPENSVVADDSGSDETYDALWSDSVQYDGAYYSDGEASDTGAENAKESEEPLLRAEYLNIRVDDAAAAEFLSTNGMSVYAETEESVSFLVTPAVAHALAGESIVTAAEADVLSGVTELMVVEIPKELSTDTAADADPGDEVSPEEEGNIVGDTLPVQPGGEEITPVEDEVSE